MGDTGERVIAVTGASGHLGQWVVAELARLGHEVLGVSRHPLDRPRIAGLAWPKGMSTLACDLADTAALGPLREALREAEGVIHLAAHIPGDTQANLDEDAERTLRSNVGGTVRLLEGLAGARRLKAFVYASTFEVYGAPIRLPVDERHPTSPRGYYGASKLIGEKYAGLFASDRAVACCALRFPAVYGPGDRLGRAIGNFIRAAASGAGISIHGDGSDLRDLVYVADAATAIVAALRRRANGVINVGSGSGYSIRALAEAVSRAAGGGVPIANDDRVKPRIDYVLDIERARADLEWEPRTRLEEGIRAQLEWVRASGN